MSKDPSDQTLSSIISHIVDTTILISLDRDISEISVHGTELIVPDTLPMYVALDTAYESLREIDWHVIYI